MGLFRVLGMQDLEIEQKVDSCFNGEQLVQLVEKAIRENEPDRYSLIITDYSMPIMDGHIASREVRRITENDNVNLKIVIVTGHVEQQYFDEAYQHGIDKVYVKPMPVVELGRLLKEMNFIENIPKHLLKDHD